MGKIGKLFGGGIGKIIDPVGAMTDKVLPEKVAEIRHAPQRMLAKALGGDDRSAVLVDPLEMDPKTTKKRQALLIGQ
jgi:hypothetical protein